MELTYHATVTGDGRIELSVPQSLNGQEVTVVVRTNGQTGPPVERRPAFGLLRGKIRIADNFDEPLDEFEDYR